YPATALVVLSGHWDQSTAFRQLGPYVRYLSKPVSQELLLWTVQQTIKEVRAGSEPLPAGAPALSGTPPNIPRQIFVRRGEVISAGDLSTGSSLQQFSPKAEIDLVLNRLKGFAEQRGITVTVQIDPELPQTIAGDSQHFRRRLLDFLTGAVRFTDRAEMELRVLKVMNREQIAVRFEC
ncbi:MAG TPA: hypothetical protein HPP80_02545, partial [Rhodospirillaceae bacterium]|nr:hypothetical protein [Rhodospirillaceae bacterium]